MNETSMNGWFVLSLICLIPLVISFFTAIYASANTYYSILKYAAILFGCSFGVIILFVVLGFIFPNVMSYDKLKRVEYVVSKEQVKNAIKEVIKEMSMNEKYELLVKQEK